MSEPFLDQTIVRSLLHYDPETGVFTWLPRKNAGFNTAYAGKRAGFPRKIGRRAYWAMSLLGYPFLGHRLAVLYMTGSWPQADTDHRDGDGLNNRWSNLRVASKHQNGANRGVNANNKVGLRGVSPAHTAGRYRATITVNRRQIWLGTFKTPEEAHSAYLRAAREHHGEFAGVA